MWDGYLPMLLKSFKTYYETAELSNVTDPNISTDALIALRHLALDYRSRQQELLKKQPWYKNLLSSSDRDKGDEQLIGVTKTTYDLIESNPQS